MLFVFILQAGLTHKERNSFKSQVVQGVSDISCCWCDNFNSSHSLPQYTFIKTLTFYQAFVSWWRGVTVTCFIRSTKIL